MKQTRDLLCVICFLYWEGATLIGSAHQFGLEKLPPRNAERGTSKIYHNQPSQTFYFLEHSSQKSILWCGLPILFSPGLSAFSSCLLITGLGLVFELTSFRSWNHPFGTSDFTSPLTDEKMRSSLRLRDLLQIRQWPNWAQDRGLGHGVGGFSCCHSSGSLAKHSHPKKKSCPRPALTEASGPGVLRCKLRLKEVWELWRSHVLVTPVTKDAWVTAGCVQLRLLCPSPPPNPSRQLHRRV